MRHQQERTVIKKEDFLRNLRGGAINISRASRRTGIHRDTYYNWMKVDKDFAVRVNMPLTEDEIRTILNKEIRHKWRKHTETGL
ncbi:MAG: hypothetical protein C3F02_01205 [Parcubacteria group bacterium]|nr:MAG: hypothetical protein C3F02_01205 [Parcubacteria group bacterium]